MKLFRIVFSLLVLTSCAAESVKSNSIGTCLKTLKPTFIWRGYNNVYIGEFFLSTNKPSRLLESDEPYGQISTGTSLELVEVIKGSNGSYGHFLRGRVEIKNGAYSGLAADLPACAPYHPVDKWIASCAIDPNALKLNAEFVEVCEKE